jgi:hypothetical protein
MPCQPGRPTAQVSGAGPTSGTPQDASKRSQIMFMDRNDILNLVRRHESSVTE